MEKIFLKNLKDLGKYRPLCHTDHGLLLYRSSKLYLMDYENESIEYLCSLPLDGTKNILASKSRLFERMFRSYARSSIAVNNGALVTYNSGIYYVDFDNITIKREHDFCTGMNNPIGFAEINNIKGFDDCIAYGEYTGNPSAGPVSIHTRNKSGEWSRAYTFEKGTIKHIHAIVPDHFRNNVLILTGDADKESGFWVAENNFKTVRPLIFGEQRYRSCAAWPQKEGILYATDTPLENNYLFFISESNNWQPEIVYEMPGPCIFSAKIGDVYYFSTSVEPDSNIKGKRYLFSYKLGNGVKERKSYIIAGSLKKGFRSICSFKKDVLPMTLFEFGNVMFPNGSFTDKLYFYTNSVCKYDGHLMTFIV